jgi:sec-independent protein translocase protein TatA
MFQNIGTPEILVIALVLMVLFVANKIPEFARGLGEAGSEFKKGLKGDEAKKGKAPAQEEKKSE